MSRRRVVAGNWKMNMDITGAKKLCKELISLVKDSEHEVVFCVPAIDIPAVVEETKGSNVSVGAQNMYFEESGAYTGEIAPSMLTDAGVRYVILGHSERREYFCETDDTVNKKIHKALEHDLIPIFCCGETLDQRKSGVYKDWIKGQIENGLRDISSSDITKIIIAYEPIWAIGTGETATSDEAQEVCKLIRDCIKDLYSESVSEDIRILYGGSVNGSNSEELFSKPDIDGGLIGGASLKADFANIVNS